MVGEESLWTADMQKTSNERIAQRVLKVANLQSCGQQVLVQVQKRILHDLIVLQILSG